MDKDLPAANTELLAMMKDKDFDEARAEALLNPGNNAFVNLNAPIADEHGYESTYLKEAVESNNLRMVSLLLQHGADPNYYGVGGDPCPFWDLQYCAEDESEDDLRLEIVKLFLAYGADPLLKTDGIHSDSLYEYALTCNVELDWDNERQNEYRWRFCNLLEKAVYGDSPEHLYQLRLPEKDYIGTYDMDELRQFITKFTVGHRIEKILWEFDYAKMQGRSEESFTDADDWLGTVAVLMLDHGFLEMTPWCGSTIKLRFFTPDEVLFAKVGEDLFTIKRQYLYYDTAGHVTDEIVHRLIESADVIEDDPTAFGFRLDNGRIAEFITDEAEECFFDVQDCDAVHGSVGE